jgi:hypothetical protein
MNWTSFVTMWTTQAYTFGIHVRHEKGRGAQGKGRKGRGVQGMAKKGIKFRGRGAAPLYFGLAGTLYLFDVSLDFSVEISLPFKRLIEHQMIIS